MPDTFDQATRSRIMSRVRSTNTTPELRLRKALFARGLRYRIYASGLPGKPDIVFPGRKVVIFVHGCQWHWHGCSRSRMPSTNVEYWERKISRNQERDCDNLAKLMASGWRVLVVWECSIKLRTLDVLADQVADWVRSRAGAASF
ncbi:very short patch repair endonuclease [Massilia sp. TN1-12]|uniref:very short patch repair endonuclease n=1 Tax=Massilia paldalensis TaxID=3377675 RepID=UPI00384D7D3E